MKNLSEKKLPFEDFGGVPIDEEEIPLSHMSEEYLIESEGDNNG